MFAFNSNTCCTCGGYIQTAQSNSVMFNRKVEHVSNALHVRIGIVVTVVFSLLSISVL